jgi:hypothetical protein
MKMNRTTLSPTSRAIANGEFHRLSCIPFERSPGIVVFKRIWLGAFADYYVAVRPLT